MASDKNLPTENFFQRLISAIFGSTDPEAEKRRLLRAIAKELSKSKYKFYKSAGNEALPGLAKYFYELYKVLSPAQVMFQSMSNPNMLKNAIIDFSLSDNQKQLAEKLTEESILTQAKVLSASQLTEQTKTALSHYLAEFDSEKISAIDSLYNRIESFKSICLYDYYFFLKKFDSNLQEKSFSSTTRFEQINAEYIVDDLKDFIAAAWALPTDDGWESTIKLLQAIKGIEPVSSAVWGKVLNRIKNLKSSKVLEMVIQCASQDPSYTAVYSRQEQHIVDSYLNKIKTQTELILKQIDKQQTNSKIDQYLNQIFGTTAVIRLKGYTETASQMFEKRGFGEFRYSQPLNFLKAFLIDYLKKDVRIFTDLVIVRGKWVSQALSAPASDAYNSLMTISEKITEFDAAYTDTGLINSKFKTLIPRTDHDKESVTIIRTLIKDANDNALAFLSNAYQNLIVFAKTVKNLIEDHEKQHPELITNWKEIDRIADPPVKEQGMAVYKQIYLFVSLLQCFLSQGKTNT